MRAEVVEKLKSFHAGEETVYSGCVINCGAGHCILKVRRKNGKITAIEPDDHYFRGVAREDRVATDEDLIKNRLQLRGCPMAWVFHKLAYAPDRILYPLMRVSGSKRMEGRYERISWDEALDVVAKKMEEIVDKYGPYSITTAYQPSPNLERLFFNDKGVGVIPVYVTSRILPGMIVMHHGGNYEPDNEGVDWGCTPNIFFTDTESPVTAPRVSNLVQVEKFSGSRPSVR